MKFDQRIVDSYGKRLYYVQMRSGAVYDNDGYDSLWFIYAESDPTVEEIAELLYEDFCEAGEERMYSRGECIKMAEEDCIWYEIYAGELPPKPMSDIEHEIEKADMECHFRMENGLDLGMKDARAV